LVLRVFRGQGLQVKHSGFGNGDHALQLTANAPERQRGPNCGFRTAQCGPASDKERELGVFSHSAIRISRSAFPPCCDRMSAWVAFFCCRMMWRARSLPAK
jgi:hypothetical protein